MLFSISHLLHTVYFSAFKNLLPSVNPITALPVLIHSKWSPLTTSGPRRNKAVPEKHRFQLVPLASFRFLPKKNEDSFQSLILFIYLFICTSNRTVFFFSLAMRQNLVELEEVTLGNAFKICASAPLIVSACVGLSPGISSENTHCSALCKKRNEI